VKLNIGGSVHDPSDPVGRLLFNVLGMIAELESDLLAELFSVARSTVYRAVQRAGEPETARTRRA